ncbi:hypothetical protein ACFX13_031914 [Malus domestica]|uniref:Uncharacterized protein n=2 Tax=Maleae TaxID=721813 RepID=A0A498KA70_MALDO|nr:hypothetical protein D8674_022728 [Pyrus ussuriensis x Pyrus communis]RXI02715.1 hypothetical protein DVH24_002793 [Malus domestica]
MVWKGLGYCLGGAVLSSTGWFLNDDADKLDSVPRISQLKDLENHGSGTVVAISGEVGSETPIDCELGGLQGVIVRKVPKS